MGIYSNSVSMMQFNVVGDVPRIQMFDWLSSSLTGRAFRPIDDNAEESSIGWVRTDAFDNAIFDVPGAFMRDNFVFFSYRHDQRKISGAVAKARVRKAEKEFLDKHPDLKRPPKREREEIKERVKLGLLAKTIPTPSTVDIAWDTKTGVLTLFTSSQKVAEKFEELFVKSFEGLRLILIHPFNRSMTLLDDHGKELLASHNQAGSESALDTIKHNTWLGQEFLVWLLHGGLNGKTHYSVTAEGPGENGNHFSAWIDNRLQFQGGGESGVQKVVVSGTQDKFAEAKTALNMGKALTGATIYLELNENQWKFNLDAERFIFKSFKCPSVQVEKESVDAFSEQESVFYERMYLLGQGLQMFNSLLLQFLACRLDASWASIAKDIQDWLEGE
ncbi:recombination-associated protein RdgC (plasmid) [Trichlorobacter lovleyi]|uniref:recombination-associated protein RdgC n=1 Tax=Trichlorobacter lovleyi TaxID=313985 RepID=UPI00223F437F|nr:recombination-associated protein RdgC [Trichlorobacter lovleyi]QOX80794.1 recombination-associated protein RdgC [Trichlorobacter lovleyi]